MNPIPQVHLATPKTPSNAIQRYLLHRRVCARTGSVPSLDTALMLHSSLLGEEVPQWDLKKGCCKEEDGHW